MYLLIQQLVSTYLAYVEIVRAARIHKRHAFDYLAIITLSDLGNFPFLLGIFSSKLGKIYTFLHWERVLLWDPDI